MTQSRLQFFSFFFHECRRRVYFNTRERTIESTVEDKYRNSVWSKPQAHQIYTLHYAHKPIHLSTHHRDIDQRRIETLSTLPHGYTTSPTYTHTQHVCVVASLHFRAILTSIYFRFSSSIRNSMTSYYVVVPSSIKELQCWNTPTNTDPKGSGVGCVWDCFSPILEMREKQTNSKSCFFVFVSFGWL